MSPTTHPTPSTHPTPAPARGPFLDRLHAGELTLMLGIRTSRTADIVQIAHSTGHHSVMVDLEHSAMSTDVAAQLCAAAGSLGMTALVRIPEREYGMIGRLLDGGAHGVVAPRVETPDEAEQIALACRFPPRGRRSQTTTVPQLGMRPTPARELNPALDGTTVVQVLLETPAGIANADAIARLDGVDMLAIGANDFTAELGVPGRYGDPRLRAAVETVAEACRRHGKLLMIGGVADRAVLGSLLTIGGCPLRLTGTDTALLYQAADASARTERETHDGLSAP
ncbi:aldolase/citrate lyase family protein [Streptomyces niveus]|uniref:Aldolase/citrate lyase family protein n=1 Tax=Streptomyces niveus TaxID=193462 RepID=A0ABZ2ACR9_STRNV|nr:aldolase/citrate lyase family protein [Streptomyces niveus]WTA57697.1 aldolase/citrate lyase family protein [Streptomyces niveus]